MTRHTLLPLVGLLAVLVAPAAGAHDFSTTDVLVLFKSDGSYQIDLTVDVDALALGVSPESDSAELAAALRALSPAEFELAVERARDTLSRRTRARFDGEKQRPVVSFPVADGALPEDPGLPTVLGTTARLAGRVPAGARSFTFGASRAFKALHVTVLDQPTATGVRHVVEPGADTPEWILGEPAAPVDRTQIGVEYLLLGFKHIVPRGLDHVLFVVALFLLSTRLKPLLMQITAFTVAHSVTLALAMYGVVSLPARWVEPLIALSIAWVAVENLLTAELKPRRTAVVFGFGLLHGLGFAGVLTELGLPRDEFVTALITFNVGVELGQLAVVGAAFLCVGWFRDHDAYRTRVVFPASGLIALTGLFWTVQRALGL